MKIGIIIPTYQRTDGRTPELLTRALTSIQKQTHLDYKVFLIGDKYENDLEFLKLSTGIIDSDKIYYENLSVAIEREKYKIKSKELWSSGGVNATNYGINTAISQDITYICHLDHDDYWSPNHLELINKVIETTKSPFIYTCSRYINNRILPDVKLDNNIIESYPSHATLSHSSVCIDFSIIPLRYRDTLSTINKVYPSDADMWERCSTYMKTNKLKPLRINTLTCYHINEKE